MLSAGIICEYNPFHLGHMEHIAATRAKLGEDTGIVCVMSGNFVQRGEPAILDKHSRAKMAILCGADLVLELPLPWATASAERFAYGAMSILNDSGVVSHISFGSECGDIEKLSAAAKVITSDEARGFIFEELEKGVSYASARQKVAEKLMGDKAILLKDPNNILGVEYIKAIDKLGAKISPMTIKRVEVYHDGEISGNFAPASKLRKLIYDGNEFADYMPAKAVEVLNEARENGRCPIDLEAFKELVLFKLRTMTEREYSILPDCSEGLWMRIMRLGRVCPSYEELISQVKTKRYALSRIRRIVLAALLGVTAEDQQGVPPYIRILAFNGRGREIVKNMKSTSHVPIITKPASVSKLGDWEQHVFELEALSTDIYSLMYRSVENRFGGQEWRIGPFMNITAGLKF